MIKFDIITIFPEIFDSYFKESILRRAQVKGLIDIRTHNIRNFAKDRHKTTDDKPYGGGAGMVMMAEPILRTFNSIPRKKKSATIIFSAKGKQFNQKSAFDLSKYDQIILISSRYEGIDERVRSALKAKEVSLGPYILTDGDVAAMALISAVSRLVPGVIKLESLREESHWNLLLKGEVKGKGLEYPHYTRPNVLIYRGKKYRVPKVLLSGNHKKIAEWREKHQKCFRYGHLAGLLIGNSKEIC
jgi:tRNA (guanine37-N1)-methyltransferase